MIIRGVGCALAVGVIAVLAGACIGGRAEISPSGSTATASPPATAALSMGPTAAPSDSYGASTPSPTAPLATPSPSVPHVDPDLERYVPARIGPMTLLRFSVPATTFTPGGDMCIVLCGNEPADFAAALGIPLGRVTIAVAMGDQGGIGGLAFRAQGVATDRLAAAGLAISRGVVGGHGPSFPMTVAGRSVTYLDRLGRGQYLVPIGDVLVFLYGEPPTTGPGKISPGGTVPPGVVALIEGLPR